MLLEPTDAIVEGGCQGTMRVEVVVPGVRAHSARSWMGVNAIHGAGEVIDRLRAYEPRRPVIDGLEFREGLNAVGIRGGVAGNVVPGECVVTVNYRFAPDRSEQDAEEHLRELFVGFDVTVTDSSPGARPGLAASRGAGLCGRDWRDAPCQVRLDRRCAVLRAWCPSGELRPWRPPRRTHRGRVGLCGATGRVRGAPPRLAQPVIGP